MREHSLKVCRVAAIPLSIVAHLKPQVEFLNSKGMDVYLVSSKGEEALRISLEDGLHYDFVEIPRSVNPLKDLKALICLFLYFRKHRFDIVHSITPKAGLLSALAAFFAGIPIRLHTFTGQPWVTLHGPMRIFSRFADRVICFLNTKCYADSRSQRDFLVKERIGSPGRLGVIGYSSIAGVDLNRFHPNLLNKKERTRLKQQLGIDEKSLVAVFVGRITRDKGMPELFSAFKKIHDEGYPLHLLLVGPLDEEYGGKKTVEMKPFLELSAISYVGYTSTPETYMAISDFLVLPSYREGFGSVVIEGAAMGLPAIGTRINGIVDSIDENRTGILIPPQDARSLYAAMKHFLNEPEKMKKMGLEAQRRCEVLFDVNQINRLLYQEYLRLAARKLKGNNASCDS